MEALEILKWIGLVLVAGFVGYFGRFLAVIIIERVHKKKGAKVSPGSPEEAATSQTGSLLETRLRVEKKRAKAEVKKAKKAGKG